MNSSRYRADYQNETSAPLLRRVRATLKVWGRRHSIRSRLRTELQEMDVTRAEKDAGLPTGELRREAYKPFWRA